MKKISWDEHQAIVSELEDRIRELESLALSDPLTHLGNHRSFSDALEQSVHRAYRHQFSVCLVLVDLGGFKRINDRFGQDFGDEVLRRFADVLVQASRRTDPKHRLVNQKPMRQGGDEFALILEYCDCSGGQIVVERVQERIEELDLVSPTGEPIELAAYFAVVCREGDALSPTQIYRDASVALTQAKAKKATERFPVVTG